jgi:nicotinamidase-related amidase
MPLVSRADSVLAVVDTQPGFVEHPAMGAAERTEAARTVERIAWLARLAAWLDVPALADVCVAQSAVALIDAGYRVVVPADATYTAREDDHRRGLARMSAAGVEIHLSKSVTYEWLEDVDTAAAILERASTEFDVLPYRL